MSSKNIDENRLYTLGKEIGNMKSVLSETMEKIENMPGAAEEKKCGFLALDFTSKWQSLAKMASIPVSAVIVIAITVTMLFPAGLSARQVLSQSMQAMAHLNSFYMNILVKTEPGENFDYINGSADFMSNRIWVVFDDSEIARYRVEKEDRVVVCNESDSTMLIKDTFASRQEEGDGFVGDFYRLFDIKHILQSEIDNAVAGNADITVTTQTADDNRKKIVLEIAGKAQTADNDNGWLRNKYITTSDHKKLFVIDKATMLLDYYQVSIVKDGEEVVVIQTETIEYNNQYDTSLFDLDIPSDAVWLVDPVQAPYEYASLSPEETARAFFSAMRDGKWDVVAYFDPETNLPDGYKRYHEGLTIVSVGTAFQSGDYPGYFVPYEIRFADGTVKKLTLALRNDQYDVSQYIIDGGF